MKNFDVAWFKDMGAGGNLVNDFRQAGTNNGVHINDSGGTNAYGCHHNHKTGGYHCH